MLKKASIKTKSENGEAFVLKKNNVNHFCLIFKNSNSIIIIHKVFFGMIECGNKNTPNFHHKSA